MISILCVQCFLAAIHKIFRVHTIDPWSSKTGWPTGSNVKKIISCDQQHVFNFSEAVNSVRNPTRQDVS